MANVSPKNEKFVEAVNRLFCCCSLRANAIIEQAEQYNYLQILESQVKEHESKSAKSIFNSDVRQNTTSDRAKSTGSGADAEGDTDEPSYSPDASRFYDERTATPD